MGIESLLKPNQAGMPVETARDLVQMKLSVSRLAAHDRKRGMFAAQPVGGADRAYQTQ